MGDNYQEALEIMCHRCVNHEACQGTGCTPKKDIKKLVDKATPKKPVRVCCEPEEEWDNEEEIYNCPNCGEPLPYNFDYDYPIKNKCCLECQQVLDWSGFDEE